MMKKVFFFLSVCAFVYGQQNPPAAAQQTTGATEQQGGSASTGAAGTAASQESPMATSSSRLQRYSPASQEALNLDPAKTERDYQVINRIVTDSEKKFGDVIATYADYGASEYYNAYTRNAIDPYSFDTEVDFYHSVKSTVNKTSKLDRDITLLKRALNRFNILQPELKILGKTPDELTGLDYKLHSMLAGVLTMRGTPSDLRNAKDIYKYILFGGADDEVKPIINDATKLKQSYQLLIGVNKLMIMSEDNDSWRHKEVADHLFYLWNLADIITADNQALKDLRFNGLLKRYAPVINVNGKRYANFYKKNFEELAKTDIEVSSLLKPNSSSTEGATATATPNNGTSEAPAGAQTQPATPAAQQNNAAAATATPPATNNTAATNPPPAAGK